MHMNQRNTMQAIEAFNDVFASIDHGQREELSATELVQVMQATRRFADRIAALAAAVTAEVSRKQAAEHSTGTPLTSLLSTLEGRDNSDAARQVFQADEITRHHTIKDAALSGTISPQQAVAVAKGIAVLPELPPEIQTRVEERYVEKAGQIGATPRRLKDQAWTVLAEVAPELIPTHTTTQEQLAAQRDHAIKNRYFEWRHDDEGSVRFHGRLPELEAEPLIKAVQAYVEQDRRATTERIQGVRAAGAKVAELRRLRDQDAARTPGQRRADALITLIGHHRGAPVVAGDRPRIVVTMTLEELQARAEQAALIPNGTQIPAGELRMMLCDADLMPAVLGSKSEILDLGRAQRLVSAPIRRALSIRDKGCIFPGCNQPDAVCHAHHIIPWWKGGPTSLNNLALLCPHHHRLIEPDRYTRRDQWRIIYNHDLNQPEVIPTHRHQQLRAGP